MSERQRDHVKRYIQSLGIWKEKNLGEQMCHDIARDTALGRLQAAGRRASDV
jgi:hypothetical protein